MAKLILQVAGITADIEASDENATPILLAYADAIGAIGTNQDKAEAVVQSLAQHLAKVAEEERIREKRRLAAEAAEAERHKWV